MSDYTIYALRVREDWVETVYQWLQNGEGRFGWSYDKNSNMHDLMAKYEAGIKLEPKEAECAQWFLLDLKEDDYVVYVNMPEYGQCTLAKVTGPYFWRWDGIEEGHEYSDFNHRFPVDPESVKTFARNHDIVHPDLKARLKLQGRYWQIYKKKEFADLLVDLNDGKVGKPCTGNDNLRYLRKEITPFFQEITKRIHATHPNFDLEVLCKTVFERIPGVREVLLNGKGGSAGDHGADLLVHFDMGLPIPELTQQKTCVVQVKSYEGEHWDTQAVKDIERAFQHYPDADMGCIISSASKCSDKLEKELEQLRKDSGKPIALIIGEDVARLFLKYGGDLLGVGLSE